MTMIENIYRAMPVPIQNLAVSAKGFHQRGTRYGEEYKLWRHWLMEFDAWPISRKLDYQFERLEAFVQHAVAASAFYRERYGAVNLGEFRSIDDLTKLPIVDKEILRAHMDAVYTVPAKDAEIARTGGTTGKSLVVRYTKTDMARRMAMLDHFKARVGFEHRRMRRASFGGRHLATAQKSRNYWRYNAACKQMLYSTYHLSEETLPYYVASLNRFKPAALDGFFSALCDIASYVERNKIDLTFRPVAIFPTSETVTSVGRELLERVFGARVYDQYASSEGAPFVTECRSGTLHVEMASGLFEQGSPNESEVLVTSFWSHGTPLIRYAIGDSMEFGPTAVCDCGLETSTISRIEGRKDDFLYGSNGARVYGANIANLFRVLPNSVIRAQMVQTTRESVTMLLEVDPDKYDDAHDVILHQGFARAFGPDVGLTIKRVASIEREPSGKHRLIKNLVPS